MFIGVVVGVICLIGNVEAHVYNPRGIPAPCSTGVHLEKDLKELQLCSDVKMKKMSRSKLFRFANNIAEDYECVLYKDKSVVCRLMPKKEPK
jgi:hypothetical protein